MTADLERAIDAVWDARDSLNAESRGEGPEAIEAALDLLDRGETRVAEKFEDEWLVREWLKKAVLLSFRLSPMHQIEGGPGGGAWWDKVPSKFVGWGDAAFAEAGFRAVPSAIVRRSAPRRRHRCRTRRWR